MKHVRRFGVTLLTFLVGIAVSPIQFYPEGYGRGKIFDGGGNFGVTVYRSSYFVKLCFGHESYISSEKADQVFDQYLSEAVKVIEVGPKINNEGIVVGHRAVA